MLHTGNKLRRQEQYLKVKKSRESTRRDQRLRRKRQESKDPRLREERRQRNVPQTLERKRKWDDVDEIDQHDHALGMAVDASKLKRIQTRDPPSQPPNEASVDALTWENGLRRAAQDQSEDHDQVSNADGDADRDGGRDEDRDSMLDPESDVEDAGTETPPPSKQTTVSTSQSCHDDTAETTESASLDLAPTALAQKFPTLFSTRPLMPKTLVTTSLHSTLHKEARLVTTLFPNSVYVPRSAHRYSHNFSVREIAKFASNRDYTVLVVLKEDQKKPTGLTVVHLPQGPTFHFSISNWVEGKKLPGHGNPTGHYPELILNNFRTPLGKLTAHLFRSIFPSRPELQGRQVVTLHNQRDYIFVRRHRYVFREKRSTEKSVVDRDGKEIKGVEGIRAGLQELGPRLTLKLRRIDTGIGRAGSDGKVEWEWKGRLDKQRTKFQL